LRRSGELDESFRLAVDTAMTLPTNTTAGLIARGRLLNTAAYASAQRGDATTALDLSGQAADIAQRTVVSERDSALFGDAQVSLYLIGVHNVLGDHARALTVARRLPVAQLPTAERQARFFLDVARAWYGHGDPERCLRSLHAIERMAPQDIRRPAVRQLLCDLADSGRRRPRGLAEFAARAGAR
jgi:hypothetical protein